MNSDNNSRFLGLDISICKSYRFSYLFSKLFIISLMLFQLLFSLSSFTHHKEYKNQVLDIITHRVALDLPAIKNHLPLDDTKSDRKSFYIKELNSRLEQQGITDRVVFVASAESPLPNIKANHRELFFTTVNDEYIVLVAETPHEWLIYFSIWPWILAVIFSFSVSYHTLINRKLSIPVPPHEIDPCVLKIDLKQKVLLNPMTGKQVPLANKPLCFYTGLVEYCTKYPNENLNPNKDLPDELDQICKKYYKRLVELGHTIRKKPSFANNLEKALSEIRAALDEVYGDDLAAKAPVYPKKAIGEGSRSKAHSYALDELEREMVDIIGR